MINYKYRILDLFNKHKEIEIDEITDKVIKEFVAIDNKVSRYMQQPNVDQDVLEEMEMELHREQGFIINYMLSSYFGYDIRKRQGVNEWYRKGRLVGTEEIKREDSSK